MFPDNKADIPFCERIFCNRSLNMKSIKAVGFDMDYTLALYKPETFEKLAYDETIKKLIEIGYPKEICSWEFDPKYMIRGLVIDKKNGNILKMDRHRYVKVAYHGFKELNREERRKLYDIENVIVYEEPHYALIDTLFSLAEAFLFIQLVEFKDKTDKMNHKSYFDLYSDVRMCIDLCHRDGSIKDKVYDNPSKYISNNKNLVSILKDLKASGRKIFIVTNSLWDYTNIVMSYLCNTKKDSNQEWISLFDLIITGSQKPSFFMTKNQIYEVDTKTNYLKNTDIVNILNKDKQESIVYQGGHFKLLHNMLGIKTGSEILYIGDHIYGDILRSKKEIGWRTMLVIEELEKEIIATYELKEQYILCDSLNEKRVLLENEFERLDIQSREKGATHTLDKNENLDKKIKKVGYDLLKLREQEKKEIRNYHLGLHPIWGELMKTGRQNSRFAAQVENYACLYTSKLTNLIHYGPHKNFRAVRDFMPHDLDE
ncbi:HAD-IG family 5'-nucleotidase [Silvanigrella aquatica]|uniref:HAD family hydrolase n=1 Tax=Silvanigrella aquatica TaxID=1915309 RepID=A0A1L4CYE9_9BACT|nr:HAD-IG family 5'-nucleotidase [Silvanigrella aquatica]APJ02974.1 hypothetical protein AXG55_03205 [Silvanigrella aquatica]